MDAAADQAHGAVASQLAAISPAEGQRLLEPLIDLVKVLGGKLEASTIADPAAARALGAISDATQDAVAAEVVDAELGFEVSDITDDRAAKLVAGKLGMLAKHREFLTWLKTPVEAPAAAPEAKAAPDTAAADDALMSSRA
jgi:hypothetical protein